MPKNGRAARHRVNLGTALHRHRHAFITVRTDKPMRLNEPVTQQEYELPAGATLMSTTDTQSYITYANETFVAVSGYSREELQGQPHNIIRHPDMPREAFADMWATLKAGEPWTALVKNRRKNGDHYWVRANAVPVVRDGRQVGHMSVRSKPTREEVTAAQALYKDFREGRAGDRQFHKGILVYRGIRSVLSLHKTIGVRARIRLNLLMLWVLTVGLACVAGDGLRGVAIMSVGSAALFAMLCGMLESQIASPIETLKKAAMDVASGASRDIQHMDRVDEIGITARTISQLGLMFRWLVDDVTQQVMTVQTAASEIAQGNDDLSVRTEKAAASVQETVSSMSQMIDSVRVSAETAAQANELATSAREAAGQGGDAVSQVVSTMKEITHSSKRIADIISVIDGIAFQTNILALNAAVEAARAGEQGRGFAVVAGEVRSLAQRSASAAKEIKTLINTSVDNVEAGAQLVDDAGRTMSDILAQVQRTSNLIGEISSATQHQTSGIAQVNQSISHLDEITQQNAALVEQSAAASSSLSHQAVRLVQALGVFR
jgi:aerotaxis receptor